MTSETTTTAPVTATLRKERDHREERVERLTALLQANRLDPLGERVNDIPYDQGYVAALDFALSLIGEAERTLSRLADEADAERDADEIRWSELGVGQDTEKAEASGAMAGRADALREALAVIGAPVPG